MMHILNRPAGVHIRSVHFHCPLTFGELGQPFSQRQGATALLF